jgi:hypothetical protein
MLWDVKKQDAWDLAQTKKESEHWEVHTGYICIEERWNTSISNVVLVLGY